MSVFFFLFSNAEIGLRPYKCVCVCVCVEFGKLLHTVVAHGTLHVEGDGLLGEVLGAAVELELRNAGGSGEHLTLGNTTVLAASLGVCGDDRTGDLSAGRTDGGGDLRGGRDEKGHGEGRALALLGQEVDGSGATHRLDVERNHFEDVLPYFFFWRCSKKICGSVFDGSNCCDVRISVCVVV